MYIKLTRFDNSPIWLNAAFVVTVEPRKQGGAIVVPIGDGLDYEVRENPEDVLALLSGEPIPAVVPVPVKDALTKTPEDVSAEPMVMGASDIVELKEEPAPKPTTRRTTKAKAAGTESAPAAPRKRATKAKTKKTPVDFPDDQIERLKKMAPGSVKKLANTLSSQFKVDDADAVIGLLAEKGVVTLDRDHVIWS